MTNTMARIILRQYFAHECNKVGDYWGETIVKQAIETLCGPL